ncbi:DMT family transporter [Aquicoccus sp. G2-2]|uniref:DMT family transporter n=1 Tax=Aquicoccus sp. G2-2 TaxID=3092120 RepID=UPI00366E5EB4
MMPIFAGLVAWPILGETVSPAAWVALGIGFLGVLCLFPEGVSGIGFGHWVAGLAALTGTISIVLSRYIARFERNALAQVFWPNLAFVVTMGAALPYVWQPMPLADLGWAIAYAVLLFAARWLLVLGLRELPAHAATSLMKLQFVWMVLLGAVVFGEWPEANTYIGAAIVICSGLYLAYEAQLHKAIARIPARGTA